MYAPMGEMHARRLCRSGMANGFLYLCLYLMVVLTGRARTLLGLAPAVHRNAATIGFGAAAVAPFDARA